MKKLFAFLLLAATLCTLPVSASTFVAMSHNEMVAQAETVVQGRVVGLESSWTESGRLIATDVTVKVDEVLVGFAAKEVNVRTFGGQVGEMMVEAHGFPQFEKGRTVLLFLTRESQDEPYRVLGYQQGHYRVVTRLDGVTLAVPQTDDGMQLISKSGERVPAARSVDIDDFKNHLRALAQSLGR